VSSETASSGRSQIHAELVAGLVDARDDPATARFDAELDSALARGTITADTAHRLRFWQRASVRLLADHARSVLPAALSALDSSQRETRQAVDDMAGTLGPQAEPAEVDPSADVDPTAEGEPSAGVVSDDDGALTDPESDTPGPTSTTRAPAAPTLEPRRNRLILADLVTTVSDDVRTDRR